MLLGPLVNPLGSASASSRRQTPDPIPDAAAEIDSAKGGG
jgi:hypothetical protein